MTTDNLFLQSLKIKRQDRIRLTGNKSLLIWLTGLSGSGKSTIANKLEELLYRDGILTYTLDGDNIRLGINSDLGFGENDRTENIRRIGEVSRLMVDAGLVVLSAFISPFEKDRQNVRKLFENGEFIEVYIKCPVEVCEERDIKGLYGKARKGELKNFTGIDSPYEEPVKPEFQIDSSIQTVEASAEELYRFIKPLLKL